MISWDGASSSNQLLPAAELIRVGQGTALGCPTAGQLPTFPGLRSSFPMAAPSAPRKPTHFVLVPQVLPRIVGGSQLVVLCESQIPRVP